MPIDGSSIDSIFFHRKKLAHSFAGKSKEEFWLDIKQ